MYTLWNIPKNKIELGVTTKIEAIFNNTCKELLIYSALEVLGYLKLPALI